MRTLEEQFAITKEALHPTSNLCKSVIEIYNLLVLFYIYIEDAKEFMDKEIKKIRKGVEKSEHQLEKLQKKDKKRDPACELGEKMKKKKKK